MDEISIDRLVFDIPGLTVEAAEELGRRVGEGLAAGSNVAITSFDKLAVQLNAKTDTTDVPQLAEAIVGSLLQQMD